jgi:hypothetical protein
MEDAPLRTNQVGGLPKNPSELRKILPERNIRLVNPDNVGRNSFLMSGWQKLPASFPNKANIMPAII